MCREIWKILDKQAKVGYGFKRRRNDKFERNFKFQALFWCKWQKQRIKLAFKHISLSLASSKNGSTQPLRHHHFFFLKKTNITPFSTSKTTLYSTCHYYPLNSLFISFLPHTISLVHLKYLDHTNNYLTLLKLTKCNSYCHFRLSL